MKKMLVLLSLSYATLFSQVDFVRGIFLFDNVQADFSRLHDSLHLNWIQARSIRQ